jgi:hypothetical protein
MTKDVSNRGEMYNFFVLGMIPGTNIQITFQLWATAFSLAIGIVLLFRFIKRSAEALPPLPLRQPLPASRLHQSA